MSFAAWSLIVGLLLITRVLSGTLLKYLPLSTAMLYPAAGVVPGPAGWAVLGIHPLNHALLLERSTEVAVLILLFSVGLKLGLPPVEPALVAAAAPGVRVDGADSGADNLTGVLLLGLSLGATVLPGAILAPTDPVLASAVQLASSGDRDRLRIRLTGEGKQNDGAAFPFFMLGLGLLGLHDLGTLGWRWWAVDVIWATAGGLMIGGKPSALRNGGDDRARGRRCRRTDSRGPGSWRYPLSRPSVR